MKKAIAVLLLISTVFCMTACGDKVGAGNNTTLTTVPTTSTTAPTVPPTTEPTKTPLHRQDFDVLNPDPEVREEAKKKFQEAAAKAKSNLDTLISSPTAADAHLDILVYYEEDLLRGASVPGLTTDASYLLTRPGEWDNHATSALVFFPTNALRIREDGTAYIVYDTDTGYRFYYFLTDYYDFMGYPVVINKSKMLSYADFKDIQLGDSIEKVETIDSITTFHKSILESIDNISVYFKNVTNAGRPPVSIHYLKDGILRIEYTLSEEEKIIVANTIFYEDFAIKTVDGKVTSHKIKNIDLPVG